MSLVRLGRFGLVGLVWFVRLGEVNIFILSYSYPYKTYKKPSTYFSGQVGSDDGYTDNRAISVQLSWG